MTLISGSGRAEERRGAGAHGRHRDSAARQGEAEQDPVFAGWFAQNGNGEMTGTTWIEESGEL